MLDIQKIIQESVHVKSAMLAECSQHIQSAAQMMIDTAPRGGIRSFGVGMVALRLTLSTWQRN